MIEDNKTWYPILSNYFNFGTQVSTVTNKKLYVIKSTWFDFLPLYQYVPLVAVPCTFMF